MKNIQSVVFDLDGLLVDSEPVWFRVRQEMFGRYRLTWTDDDQKALMGKSTAAWIEYVDEKLQGQLRRDEIFDETIQGMVSQYRAGNVRVMPGADEALRSCARNSKLGLASGSPRILIDSALAANRWEHYFSQIISSDEVLRGKPAPDVYAEVMKRLEADPAGTVVLEDSESGIIAGKAAGAAVIAVPNEHLMPSPEVLRTADVVIPSLKMIEAAMKKIESSRT
ncbi:MAG: HAD family phosphatase [Ignavibacteria bacterium]|nr:HAD family phosphatase [Ignavibacteria bacterium]